MQASQYASEHKDVDEVINNALKTAKLEEKGEVHARSHDELFGGLRFTSVRTHEKEYMRDSIARALILLKTVKKLVESGGV